MTPPDRTDWDVYYQRSPAAARFTRPLIQRVLMSAFQRFSPPNPVLVELGGAGSRVFDAVMREVRPVEYHVVDSNQFGLDVLRQRTGRQDVFLHCADVLHLDLPVRADVVFSLGLIEHFDEAGTREAVLAHFRLLKPGGIAIISFPTPTFLYRASRAVAEFAGKWIFHDERPLWPAEVAKAFEGQGELLYGHLIWPIFFTQTLIVVRKYAAGAGAESGRHR
jgi:SAM-dependent methyltransferase